MTRLAFFVSSAMCPEASNPIIVPAVNKLQGISFTLVIKTLVLTMKVSSSKQEVLLSHCLVDLVRLDVILFTCADSQVIVKTSLAERKP
jgi:hypothetical protein